MRGEPVLVSLVIEPVRSNVVERQASQLVINNPLFGPELAFGKTAEVDVMETTVIVFIKDVANRHHIPG